MKFKIKEGFLMKKIADEFIVIPRGEVAVDFNATLVFNQSGALLWEKMNSFTSVSVLAEILVKEYAIEKEAAVIDVERFVLKLKDNDLLLFSGDTL